MSRGSLEELIDDLNACLDEPYAPKEDLEVLKDVAYELLERINGYAVYFRKRENSGV